MTGRPRASRKKRPAGVTPVVAIADAPQASPDALLADALERAGLWNAIAQVAADAGLAPDALRVVVHPDFGAFEAGSAAVPSPPLVEALVDLLHARGYSGVALAATTDDSWFWAENRSVAALADLLGYRYVTPAGADYDIVDLSEDLVDGGFEDTGVLRGALLARAWRDAHVRICVARNRTDEREGYALCLHGLLGVLPQAAKGLFYRQATGAGEAVCALLGVAPVHCAIVDASVSAHGSGGSRAPTALATGTLIASLDVRLADFVGALKMGLDPHASRLAAAVFDTLGLPPRYVIDGNVAPYGGWRNVDPFLRDSVRRRDALPAGEALLAPWLQKLDPELFPLKHPIDAKVNARAARFFEDPDRDPAAMGALLLVNHAIGALGSWRESWRVLADKDALARRSVPLGFDPHAIDPARYAAIHGELDQLEGWLAGTPPATDSLRWREVEGATVFAFERTLAIPFDTFVAGVDVARTIEFMNDYLGGVRIAVESDEAGRPRRQAERNLYLPQPNYLVLYGGQPIDVGKIEVCDYAPDRHRMAWKTIESRNGSAQYDDGVVTFERVDRGTRVRIVGRQRFVLPPFWQAVDLDLVPEFKAALVTHAYDTFFSRTIANFEALVEGREIRIGRAPPPADDPFAGAPRPVEMMERGALALLAKLPRAQHAPQAPGSPPSGFVDADGFRHFTAPSAGETGEAAPAPAGASALADWLGGLAQALARDAHDSMAAFTPESR